MAQYFKIINLTRMVALYDMGKLGESVYESFDELISAICEVDTPPSIVALSKHTR